MLDNRWPHLCEVDRIPGMHPSDRSRMGRVAHAVAGRTDFKTAYNRVNGCLFFYLNDASIGAAVHPDLTYIRRKDGFKVPDDLWTEELVRTLQRGRASRAVKERAEKYAEQSAESDARSIRDRQRGETPKAVEKHLRRTLNRRGMSSRFRPSAVVDGLKGTTP